MEFAETEAVLRTAVGRAYYSSFLKCFRLAVEFGRRELLEYQRSEHPRVGEIHRAVRDALFDIEFGNLASKLKDLFDKRVTADYYPAHTVDRHCAEEALELSQNINSLVDETRR